MERHPQALGEGIARKDGSVSPFNAGDAVAAVCEMHGGPIPRQHRARLGKAARELLEDGFDPPTVCAALECSVLKARPDLAPTFALEIANAKQGELWTWTAYRMFLMRLARMSNPELDRVHQALEEYFS